MKVRVQLFAVAKELAGCEVVECELAEGARVAELREALAAQYPALAGILSHSMFSVDQQYAENDDVLSETAEVACLPPVSGG